MTLERNEPNESAPQNRLSKKRKRERNIMKFRARLYSWTRARAHLPARLASGHLVSAKAPAWSGRWMFWILIQTQFVQRKMTPWFDFYIKSGLHKIKKTQQNHRDTPKYCWKIVGKTHFFISKYWMKYIKSISKWFLKPFCWEKISIVVFHLWLCIDISDGNNDRIFRCGLKSIQHHSDKKCQIYQTYVYT